tara:strand:- start:754 stop:1056 length:303 start_codon:yes stop_codon:yes gene_type:complete
MKRMMKNGNGHVDFAMRILGTLLTAAIIGAWGYSITRASANDLKEVDGKVEKVDREGHERERRIGVKLNDIKTTIHRMDVSQSAFQAQVREALRIPRGND